MGLNIDKLRAKLAETQEKMKGNGGGGDFSFWSPKDGRNVVRIMPPKEGQEFYVEARVHYHVGPDKKMVVCGKTDRNTCIVCEFVSALWETKDKADEALAKRMKSTGRYYFNVIDRSVEEDTEGFGDVSVFGSGSTIFTDMLGIIVDPDYGDITDKALGYDLIITKSGKDMKTEYKTNARPKQTAIGIDDWEEKLIDLSFFAKSKSDDELEAILGGDVYVAPEADSDGEEEKAPKKEATKKPAAPVDDEEDDETGSDADDIEAEINAVLNKHKK